MSGSQRPPFWASPLPTLAAIATCRGEKSRDQKALEGLGIDEELSALPEPRPEISRHRPGFGRYAISARRIAGPLLERQIPLWNEGRLEMHAHAIRLGQLDGVRILGGQRSSAGNQRQKPARRAAKHGPMASQRSDRNFDAHGLPPKSFYARFAATAQRPITRLRQTQTAKLRVIWRKALARLAAQLRETLAKT